MKNIIKFLVFICYSILIFFINNYIVLGIITIINAILIVILKLNFKDVIKKLLKLFVFIGFTIIINIIVESIDYAILIAIKLLLICNITYIFSKTITYMEFAEVIEKIFYPLKIFKIDSKNVGLIICISIAFIPILQKELEELKNALKIKGFKINLINILKNINIISKPFFISILRKVNELENSLAIKGYMF